MREMPKDNEIYSTLVQIVSEALLVKEDEIKPESRFFSDLNAESIDIVDIRFRIEQAFGFKIDQNEMIRYLGDAVELGEIQDHFTVHSLVEYIKHRLEEVST